MSDLSKTCSRLGNAVASIAMQARLADLDGYWLEAQCCGHSVLPLRQLAQKRGQQRLCEILPLLTCKRCGKPPARAWLNETHHRADHHGAPPGWSVQLIPAGIAGVREAAE